VPHTARAREQRKPEHGVRKAVPYLDVRHVQQPAAEGRADPAGILAGVTAAATFIAFSGTSTVFLPEPLEFARRTT
jgi:hypothetical protein